MKEKIDFDLIKRCSDCIAKNTPESLEEVREICIRILNTWNDIDPTLKPAWNDVFESIGFYPYIEKEKLPLTSWADNVRKESHRSAFMEGVFYHSEQKKIASLLLAGKSVIISAPTSFGKSLLIEEVVASKRYHNIVIIQPTLALLDETRMKLRKYNDDYNIIVRTTQKPSDKKRNLFLLTAERVMEYEDWPAIDFLVIDEFYKLSLHREDSRAATLNNAFLRIVGSNKCPFYMLGPNIEGISAGFAEKYNATFVKTNYALVGCDIIDRSDGIAEDMTEQKRDKLKAERLFTILDDLQNEQTLIYCSTPARARRFARAYFDHILQNKKEANSNPLSDWIEENISSQWSLAEELRNGIAFHDGSLPKHIGSSIIRYFNAKAIRYIFCTSTIIEGVNTSAKNVVLLDNTKGEKALDFFDYSNIKGRSGRFMEHYVGRVYNIAQKPTEQKTLIDIPLYHQNPIVDEILINIPKDEVILANRKRKAQIEAISPKLKEVIRRNGVNIVAQLNIYREILSDISLGKGSVYQWTRIPSWDNLQRILELAGDTGCLITYGYSSGVVSARQLTKFLYEYSKHRTINTLIDLLYNNIIANKKEKTIATNKQKYYDLAIEKAFHIYRHLFLFTVPKAITVVDSLQRLAFEEHGQEAGSYTFYVQQLENEFIDERLAFLVEYGLPAASAQKLVEHIGSLTDENEITSYIKAKWETIVQDWLPYEIEQLNKCIY